MPEVAERAARNTEFVARFNAAMAEAGYPEERLWVGADGNMYGLQVRSAPTAVEWQALYLAKQGDAHPCWSCWEVASRADPFDPYGEARWGSDCVTGRRGGCHFPNGPAFPPRHLLAKTYPEEQGGF